MPGASSDVDRDRDEQGLRELRLVIPDARSEVVLRRVAASSARLSPDAECDAMRWIESVSAFDDPDLDHTT